MLQIKGFTKDYGGFVAVDHLDLTVEKGDIYGFIGHNGAGKTTTIKAVAGILDFHEGDILIDGLSILRDPVACKQQMAYIPDNPDIYESMTGIGYLNFTADIYGVTAQERKSRIDEYAQTFEIDQQLGQRIGSYSHGMKQKLVLISALVHQPRLLLLDEPFVGLDPKASFSLKEIMRAMVAQGAAIFFSTHVLEVAEKLCSKIAIIQKGRLVAHGPTERVKGDSSLEEVFLELIDHA